MNTFLINAFKQLTDVEVPHSVHIATYRAMVLRRYRRYIITSTSIVTATFLFSLWNTYARMIEADAFSTIKALVDAFEFNVDSAVDSAQTVFNLLPIQAITLSVLNLGILVFAVFLFRAFNKMQGQLLVA